jgi:hypothetical protein
MKINAFEIGIYASTKYWSKWHCAFNECMYHCNCGPKKNPSDLRHSKFEKQRWNGQIFHETFIQVFRCHENYLVSLIAQSWGW